MKKILALILAALLAVSVFALAGCDKEENDPVTNVNSNLENFDSYVDESSQIIGEWVVVSSEETTQEVHWTFFKNTTVHISYINGDVSTSDVGAYNYDDETSELSYYVYQTGETTSCTVTIDGSAMELVYADGTTVSLEKYRNI